MFRRTSIETRKAAALRQGVSILAAVMIPVIVLGIINMTARWIFVTIDTFHGPCSDLPKLTCYGAPKDFWQFAPIFSGDWVMSHLVAGGVLTITAVIVVICWALVEAAIDKIADLFRSARLHRSSKL